ncbi:hypothetical protein L195_g060737 [Trifolium pratense]|uniref:Uncharacterized protein n=1 Tax=Trifolium pratense TaxID=57577 RepID=A0A2K3K5N1_TRIPR|nr:hypothetical protein L195_g060737 [Trifolium pratense]
MNQQRSRRFRAAKDASDAVDAAVRSNATVLGDSGDEASCSFVPLDGRRLEVVVMCGGYGGWLHGRIRLILHVTSQMAFRMTD